MDLSFVYWEGAVDIEGSSAGQAVTGWGFVELTGYGESMQGVF
jgi:predicted secreted hydrolase